MPVMTREPISAVGATRQSLSNRDRSKTLTYLFLCYTVSTIRTIGRHRSTYRTVPFLRSFARAIQQVVCACLERLSDPLTNLCTSRAEVLGNCRCCKKGLAGIGTAMPQEIADEGERFTSSEGCKRYQSSSLNPVIIRKRKAVPVKILNTRDEKMRLLDGVANYGKWGRGVHPALQSVDVTAPERGKEAATSLFRVTRGWSSTVRLWISPHGPLASGGMSD